MEDVREQHGVVQYETNVLGSKGPRRMKVMLPKVNREGIQFKWKSLDVRLLITFTRKMMQLQISSREATQKT
jgi:Tub family